MRARKDLKPISRILTSLRQEQGRENSFIPKNERVRQVPIDEALRAIFGMTESKLENLLVATFFITIFTTMVATRTPRFSTARTSRHSMAGSQLVQTVMTTDSFKAKKDFFTEFRVQTRPNVVHATGGEDTFSSIFPVSRIFDHHTRTW